MASRTGVVNARSCKRSLIYTNAVPQSLEQVRTPSWSTVFELQTTALSLYSLSVFRDYESAEAGDQALEGSHVELVTPTKRMDDLGMGIPLFGVPGVVGQLNILNLLPIFVPTFYSAYIHAHIKNMYANNCQ